MDLYRKLARLRAHAMAHRLRDGLDGAVPAGIQVPQARRLDRVLRVQRLLRIRRRHRHRDVSLSPVGHHLPRGRQEAGLYRILRRGP